MHRTFSSQDTFPSHNIDPVVVPTWTRTWKNANKNEKFYADPLVYTPSGTARELVQGGDFWMPTP